jgi:hypothetical protein
MVEFAVGGAASAEIYDPKTGTFRTAGGSLDTARYYLPRRS